MSDLHLTDSYGEIVLPDDNIARHIYDEVCVNDTYGFGKLHADGFCVKTAIDLGASYGVATRMIQHHWPDARIVAFEPDQSRAKYLVQNCPLVYRCRTDAVAGFANDRARLVAGIGADFGKWRPDPAATLVPPVDKPITVKEAFSDFDTIDLIKIDVEGFELGIFQDAAENDMLKRIRYIVGEWHFANSLLGLQKALSVTHEFTFRDDPRGNPWNLFWAKLRTS